jgi:hypothetical protein
MPKRIYQFQLRLGVHRIPAQKAPQETPHQAALRFAVRDALQQPLDFSVTKPDVIYHLRPRQPHQPKKS